MYLESAEYKDLKSMTAYICSISREMLFNTLTAFENMDIKKAEYIIERDKELDDFSLKSDELCGKIIALYWPRGSDMRYIISTIKTSSDFERIGDHCKRISKQIIKLSSAHAELFKMNSILELLRNVVQSVSDAADAYYTLNKSVAIEIIEKDKKIDILKSNAVRDIIGYMTQEGADLKAGINMVNVARRLERMADHGKNIAEAVIYTVSGRVEEAGDKDNEESTTC